MNNAGFYVMQRGWQEHPAFAKEPYTEREAFEWLIGNAAFKACRRRVGTEIADLERGQLAASLRYLCGAWKWKSDKRVRGFLRRMEAEGMVFVGKTEGQKWTQITICNYDKYQLEGRTTDAPRTHHGRKIEEGNNISSSSLRSEEDAAKFADAHVTQDVLDPAKQVFDAGVKLLRQAGQSEPKARAFIGKLRKAHTDEAIIVALGKAQREGAIDPVSFIVGCLKSAAKHKPEAPPGFRRINGELIPEIAPKPEGTAHENRERNSTGCLYQPSAPRQRDAANDVPAMQRRQAEKARQVSSGDNRRRDGSGVLPSLCMELR